MSKQLLTDHRYSSSRVDDARGRAVFPCHREYPHPRTVDPAGRKEKFFIARRRIFSALSSMPREEGKRKFFIARVNALQMRGFSRHRDQFFGERRKREVGLGEKRLEQRVRYQCDNDDNAMIDDDDAIDLRCNELLSSSSSSDSSATEEEEEHAFRAGKIFVPCARRENSR